MGRLNSYEGSQQFVDLLGARWILDISALTGARPSNLVRGSSAMRLEEKDGTPRPQSLWTILTPKEAFLLMRHLEDEARRCAKRGRAAGA